MTIDKNNPFRKALIELLHSINEEIHLSKSNIVLILHLLNTEDKIMMFNEWVKSKLNEGKFQATEVEIARAAVQASKEFKEE